MAFVPGPASGFPRHRSLRWQVMTAVIAINLCAALVALVVVIANARRATEAEILSSLAVAERLVQDRVERVTSEGAGSDALARLPLHLGGVRHVRLRIESADGRVIDVPSTADEGEHAADEREVPGWFTALITVARPERAFPVVADGRMLGRVVVAGEASDEIEEVWEDMSALALLAVAVNLAILAALYVVLGRLLMPLKTLSAGLSELEAGRFEHRLPTPSVRELAMITDRFNALGAALKLARDDNAQLNERLIRVQDDERREIASELHDELGPCVFGLRANLESLVRLSARAEPELARRIGERSATMVEIIDRIQGLNRRLLRRIRPMALGHVPLAAVIADLVADFESHAPDRQFQLSTEGLVERYGDCIDLTVYRCIQEAATNALRHGGARNISIEAKSEDGRIALLIADDGSGFEPGALPGYGLIGIEERISVLGGNWRITPNQPRGTRVSISIPTPAGDAGATNRKRASA
ncbi:histidine kinase [Ancylobacter sp. A5.8]|uniref:ATP-binding protein n=1 Tax=Ancylobacter gelatini TaxID=2919920 RepID=UPI001F4D8745|nr:ATP-binding protein [Ancylobacter gelatini]MCJ8144044.1 histidine kinase [Ancylobacter gelatini]